MGNYKPPKIPDVDTTQQGVKQAIARMQQQGHVPNFASLGNRRATVQQPQSYERRQEIEAQNIYGPPEGWDYKTAQTDWDGKEMPYGAVGFTPQGEAYYGGKNSWEEWWNRTSAEYKYNNENGWLSAGNRAEQSYEAGMMKKQAEELWGQGEYFASLTARVGVAGKMLDAIAGGAAKGEEMTSGQKVAAVTGDAFGALFTGIQRSAEWTAENVVAYFQGVEDVAATSGLDPLAGTEEWREGISQDVDRVVSDLTNPTFGSNVADFSRFAINALDVLNPLVHMWNAYRYYQSPLSKGEKEEMVDRRIEAGRVLYSSWVDTAVTQTYLDRVRQGENPYLLELELQSPGWEMMGEIIFDPLNLLDVHAKLKSATSGLTNYVEFAGRKSADIAADISDLDKLDDIARLEKLQDLAADTKRAAAVSDDATDIGKVIDDAPSLFDEIGIAGDKAKEAIAAGDIGKVDDSGKLRKAFNQWFAETKVGKLGKTRLLSFTDKAKAWHIERVSTDFMGKIFSSVGGEPDDVRSMIDAFAMITSKNTDEVAEGIAMLGNKLPLDTVLSDGGLQFSHIVREMFTDANGVFDQIAFANKVNDIKDADALLAFYNGQIQRVSKKLFPTLTDRKAIFDKALEAVDKGKMTLEDANKLDLTSMEKFWLGIENVTDNKYTTGIRNFYAQIYMGINPGYAMRNMFNNTLTTLIDKGPGAYFDGFRFLSPSTVDEQLTAITRGAEGLMADIGFTKADVGAKSGLAKYNTLNVAAGWENVASKRIMLKSYKDTFSKMLPEIITQSRPILEQAGYSDDVIKHLENLVNTSWGQIPESIAKLRGELELGSLNLFEGMGWVPPEVAGFLDEFNMMERAKDIVRSGKGKEEIASDLQELFESARKLADQTKHIVTSPPANLNDLNYIDGDPFHVVYQMITDTIKTDGLKAAGRMGQRINRQADAAYWDVTHELLQIAKTQLGDAEVAKLFEGTPIQAAYEALLKEEYYTDIAKNWENIHYTYPNDVLREVKRGSISVEDGFRKLGVPPQEGIDAGNFGDYVFQTYQPKKTREYFSYHRDTHRLTNLEIQARLLDAGIGIPNGIKDKLDNAEGLWRQAQLWDYGVVSEGAELTTNLSLGKTGYENHQSLLRLAMANGVDFSTKGKTQSPHFLRIVNAELKKLLGADFVKYERFEDIPIEDAYIAFINKYGDDFVELGDLGDDAADVTKLKVTIDQAKRKKDVAELAETDFFRNLREQAAKKRGKIIDAVEIPSPMDDTMPSEPHRYQQAVGKINDSENVLLQLIDENFEMRQAVDGIPDGGKALEEYLVQAGKKENGMHFVAGEIATATRNFALHDYNAKRGFDTTLSMVFPYQFWHSRTYARWSKRAFQHPGLIAAYAKYKEALAQSHAGMPEWYKYQVNTAELLGIWPDHPLFFNLESTLNPLNGLTGVDFNDPAKRVNTWTNALDSMNKFGPTTHPLLSVFTAIGMMAQGETEAAARWGGKLLPQTTTLQAIDALFGEDPVGELDPFVHLFSGGVDPYLRRRVGRALSQMVIDGEEKTGYTEEEILDAAHRQEGEIWELAKTYAIRERAPGQLASFIFGQGFKARNQGDLLTDKMYTEFFRLLNNRDNMSNEQFRIAMSQMSQDYRFMDTVLVSAKSGADRDLAYAYAVLGRIPPGATSAFYEAAGIDRELINMFYENKGDMSGWTEGDQKRFMAGIVDFAAVLTIPDNYTQNEWDGAKNNYNTMLTTMATNFGEDIHDKIDAYWSYKNRGEDGLANLYLESNPIVERAMDFKSSVIVSDPLLSIYYGSVKRVDGYYTGQMYNQAEALFGKGIFDLNSEYWGIPENERRAFRRQHPELVRYWEFKEQQQKIINQSVIRIRSQVGEPLPAGVREETFGGVGEQAIAQTAQAPRDQLAQLSNQEWLMVLGERVYGLAIDAMRGERTLSYQEKQTLDQAARQFNIDRDRLIQYVNIARQ